MGCNCGKGGTRCVLCHKKSNKFYVWGTKQVCWRCRDEQLAKIEKRKKENERVEKLLQGKNKKEIKK